jgi:hypothetical protein
MQRVAKHSIEIGAICARQVIIAMRWLKKLEKEFTPMLIKSLGSAGMKKEMDFTKQRNPSGQEAGAILPWGEMCDDFGTLVGVRC